MKRRYELLAELNDSCVCDCDIERDPELNASKYCRDERCSRIELHLAHPVTSPRGRAPNVCPRCNSSIPRGQGPKCYRCGWDRLRDPKPRRIRYPAMTNQEVEMRFGPDWTVCPSCNGYGLSGTCRACECCGDSGVVRKCQ
jgi:hypothetical protein